MSSLYADIDSLKYRNVINDFQQYADAHKMDVFMFKLPKSDLNDSDYDYKNCFMILSVGYKVALINGGTSEDDYNNYCEDVYDIISYLFSKYEYRAQLGRFKKWGEPLINTNIGLEDLNDVDKFWKRLKASNPQEKKYTELLVTLCTGSINDINRVKAEVPRTLLDQVKQKILAFDADQTRFIYQELDKKLVKIQGLSGTGKTELLLHKLKELYQKPEKYKIFITCHNHILAESLHERIPQFFNVMKVSQQIEWEQRLWCTNAWGGFGNPNSGLYRYICGYYEISYYNFRQTGSFDRACKFAIDAIKRKYPDGKIPSAFDYILIDECQDFKKDFFELCKLVTSKQVYIAGDVFQSIFYEDESKDYEADFFLKKCYRTDPRTLMFAHGLGLGLFESTRLRWLSKEDWEACGYSFRNSDNRESIVLSREPVRRFLDINDDYDCLDLIPFTADNFLQRLLTVIKRTLKDNPTSTVNDFCIIMLDEGKDIYELANIFEKFFMMALKWRINKAYETKHKIPNTLLISNRNNVKGLEYPFVICITKKITSDYTYRNAIYTMLTRSFLKTFLFLPNHGAGISKGILDGYHEIMSERQMTIKIPSDNEKEQIETRFEHAKQKKPLADIIKDGIEKMNLQDHDLADRLYNAALQARWENLSEEEIYEHLLTMKNII